MAVVTVSRRDQADSATCGVQEAIDSLPPEGGTVFLPAGRYTLRASIRCVPNLRLCGEGEATVLTRPAPVTRRLARDTQPHECALELDEPGEFSVADELFVRDFTQGGWHSRAMVARQVAGKTVRGDILRGDPERAYSVSDGAWVGNYFPAVWVERIEGVTIESLAIDGGEHEHLEDRLPGFVCSAVHARLPRRLRISQVTVLRWFSDGIGVQGGSATVTNCIVEQCMGNGLHPGTNLDHSLWTGNICRGNEHGLYFCSSVKNTIVAQNICIANRRNGIWGLSDPDRYNVVIGNVCAENGMYGIEASKGLGNALVGNLCRGNSRRAPGNFSGILLEKHRDSLAVGNLCVDDQERPTQLRGVTSVDPAGSNLVESNHSPQYSGHPWSKQAQRNLRPAGQKEKRDQGEDEKA